MGIIHSYLNIDTEKDANRSYNISREIESYFTSGPLKVLELGCENGEITFNLKHRFFTGLLVDECAQQINNVNEKIHEKAIYNIKTACGTILDITSDERFDIIYTSLHLHHNPKLQKTIYKLYDLLNKNGKLIIVDFLPDNGIFHKFDQDFNGYHGFTIDEMSSYLEKAQFNKISGRKFFSSYEIIDNIKYPYSLFSVVGIK